MVQMMIQMCQNREKWNNGVLERWSDGRTEVKPDFFNSGNAKDFLTTEYTEYTEQIRFNLPCILCIPW